MACYLVSSFEHIALNILTFSSLSGLDAAVFMQIMIPTEQIVSAFQQSLLHPKITFSQGEKKKGNHTFIIRRNSLRVS